MALLITSEDVYNYLNIDLAQVLNVKNKPNETTVVTRFLEMAQDDVAEYIGLYAYRGREEADRYFANTKFTADLVNAILAQIDYINLNGKIVHYGGIMMQGNSLNKLTIAERLEANFSPKAHAILSNANMLYGARW